MNDTLVKSQLFGPVTYTESEGAYQSVNFQDTRGPQEIVLQIFEGLSPAQLAQVEQVIDKLPTYSDSARDYLLAELGNDNGTIDFFISFHKDELGDDLAEFFDVADVTQLASEKIIRNLYLNNVVFYHDNKSLKIVFDYMINPKMSDEILVVSCDLSGKVVGLTHES